MKVKTTILVAGEAAFAAALVFAAATVLLLPTPAWPHPVTTIQGTELPITYPSGCCNSAATMPNGDCAPIDDRYVTEGPDGYEVDLPIGAHPKLKKKGFKGVVPYSRARKIPLSNDYHICLAADGFNLYCFFPKPGAV